MQTRQRLERLKRWITANPGEFAAGVLPAVFVLWFLLSMGTSGGRIEQRGTAKPRSYTVQMTARDMEEPQTFYEWNRLSISEQRRWAADWRPSGSVASPTDILNGINGFYRANRGAGHNQSPRSIAAATVSAVDARYGR